jgi:hypothetical protein
MQRAKASVPSSKAPRGNSQATATAISQRISTHANTTASRTSQRHIQKRYSVDPFSPPEDDFIEKYQDKGKRPLQGSDRYVEMR